MPTLTTSSSLIKSARGVKIALARKANSLNLVIKIDNVNEEKGQVQYSIISGNPTAEQLALLEAVAGKNGYTKV